MARCARRGNIFFKAVARIEKREKPLSVLSLIKVCMFHWLKKYAATAKRADSSIPIPALRYSFFF